MLALPSFANDDTEKSEFRHFNTITERLVARPLPGVNGVFPLSIMEIRKDFREVEKSTVLDDDEDSDGSVRSRDIPMSNYPVRPRRTPKSTARPLEMARGPYVNSHQYVMQQQQQQQQQHQQHQHQQMIMQHHHMNDYGEDEDVDQDISDTLEFIKNCDKVHPDIFKSEQQRELLEVRYMALRDEYSNNMGRIATNRSGEDNYLRVLQGLYCRSLRVHRLLNRKISVVGDILVALERRREMGELLELGLKAVKTATAAKKGSKNSSKEAKGAEALARPMMLRVTVPGRDGDVVFHKGQWICTPNGEGRVIEIRAAERKLTVDLGYGTMHATVAAAVGWMECAYEAATVTSPDAQIHGITSMVDYMSDESMIASWQRNEMNFSVSQASQAKLAAVLKAKGGDAADGVLDLMMKEVLEEVEGNGAEDGDDGMEVDDGEEGGGGGDAKADGGEDGATHSSGTGRGYDGENGGVAEGKGTGTGSLEPDTVGPVDVDGVSPTSIAELSRSKDGMNGGSTADGRKRLAARAQRLMKDVSGSMMPGVLDALPFAFAASETLPAVLEKVREHEAGRGKASVSLCKGALSDGSALGTTGSVVWDTDTAEFERVVAAQTRLLTERRAELHSKVAQLLTTRGRSTRLAQASMALRLSSFTRRIRHRMALSAAQSGQPSPPITPAKPLIPICNGRKVLVLDTGSGNGTAGQTRKGSAVEAATKAGGKAKGGGARGKRASKVSIAEPAVSESQAAPEDSADRDAARSPEPSPSRAAGGRASSRAAAGAKPAADKAPTGKSKRGSAAMEETTADKDDRDKDEEAAPKKKAKRVSRRG